MNWARVRQLHSSDKAALQQLHKEEGKLFGGAHIHSRDEQSQEVIRAEQSRVAIRVRMPNAENGCIERASINTSSGLQYLLGMGLFKRGDGVLRPAIGAFTLDLHLSPSLTSDQCRQVEEAVLAFGLLGGLGSRARHGWGSVSLQKLDGGQYSAPTNREEYINCINRLLAPCSALEKEPPFSAFCHASRIDISAESGDAMALLQKLGSEQQIYRSWGQKGLVAGQEAEQNFPEDHDWAYRISRGESVSAAPDRAVFGLPHNYSLSGTGAKIDNQVEGNRRRAAPLLAHIHHFDNDTCLLVQTLLQSQFLPEGLKMEIKPTGGRLSMVSVKPKWQVIHTFMDRFSDRETLYGH